MACRADGVRRRRRGNRALVRLRSREPVPLHYKQLGFKLVRAGRANLFKPDESVPDSAVTTDYLVDRLVIVGTVDRVVDEIVQLYEEVGGFGTLLYCGIDWADPVLARRSMELMAEEVVPRVNSAVGA